ncbi:DUF6412 domain-containing protein [Streptacidiphilus sp. ASG 303]|uniref:DUF6412 domain-containing protein n=1 Tax=Streptacidiphilus sp. ASG 303 TaxID=2896847 RepID=UPI001E3137F7|nr:DUF6412 domain-containing protein [Streptacidiphilus sp. ASG 303]MCD0485849.1 DUF6412 domain-containing protein [Streptacidiphilus sp. ASG 303]
MQLLAAAAGQTWHALAHLLAAPAAPAALAALAAAATLALLAGLVAGVLVTARLLGASAPHAVRDRALRLRARRTAFLPQRDPDARGRSRPRAPSAAAPTAA